MNLSADAPETAAYLRGETIQLSEEDAGKRLVPCECGRVFARMGQEERRDAEKPLSEGTAEAVLIEEGKILRHRSRKLHCFPSDRMPECHRIGVKRLPSDEAVIRVV